MKARKVLALALVGMLATVVAFGSAWQTNSQTWKYLRAASASALDSASATIGGNPITTDTCSYWDNRNIGNTSEGSANALPGASLGPDGDSRGWATAWLWSAGGTVANVDTLFFRVDRSFSPTGPWIAGTFVPVVLTTANAKLVKFDFLASADSVRGVPYLRIAVRSDGNSAARFDQAKLNISRR